MFLFLKDVLLADANEVLINRGSSFKNYTSDRSQSFTSFIEVIKPLRFQLLLLVQEMM